MDKDFLREHVQIINVVVPPPRVAPAPTLEACNACEVNAANPADPGGYCDECRVESPLNRNAVEELARTSGILYNCVEWVDTGGGVHNVLFHTLHGTEGHEEGGPVIAVGPFSHDGEQEFPGVVFVSVETRNDEGIECPNAAAVNDALVLLWNSPAVNA